MPDLPSSSAEPLNALTLTPPQQELADVLRNIGGPLFAVLDAARDPLRILTMLRSSGEEYQSLYAGMQGKVLEAYAPYLVHLTPESNLLDALIAQGWGKNWGIFAVTAVDFTSLRNHFRTFLLVKNAEGRRLYFRYYDPRILRAYLPTCNVEESNFVFGPVAAFLCEGKSSNTLQVFQSEVDGPRSELVDLMGTADYLLT